MAQGKLVTSRNRSCPRTNIWTYFCPRLFFLLFLKFLCSAHSHWWRQLQWEFLLGFNGGNFRVTLVPELINWCLRTSAMFSAMSASSQMLPIMRFLGAFPAEPFNHHLHGSCGAQKCQPQWARWHGGQYGRGPRSSSTGLSTQSPGWVYSEITIIKTELQKIWKTLQSPSPVCEQPQSHSQPDVCWYHKWFGTKAVSLASFISHSTGKLDCQLVNAAHMTGTSPLAPLT